MRVPTQLQQQTDADDADAGGVDADGNEQTVGGRHKRQLKTTKGLEHRGRLEGDDGQRVALSTTPDKRRDDRY